MDARTLVALCVTLFFWASAFVGIRAGLEAYSPGHLALLRFLTASAVLGAYALFVRMRLPRLGDLPRLAVHGFFGFTVYHVFLNYGEQSVSAASACFLIGAIPIFTTILAVLMLGERLTRRGVWGIVLGFLGICIIALGEGDGLEFNLGALMVVIAAFSESLFMVLQKPFLSRYSALEYVSYTLWMGTVFMLVFTPELGLAVAEAPWDATLAVVYLGICPAAVAYVTWAYALARTEVSRVVATQFSMPAITIALGFVWLGELPTPLSVAGGVVALAGVALIVLRRLPRPLANKG